LHATAASEARSFRRLGLSNPAAVIPNAVDAEEFADLPSRSVIDESWPALRGRRIVLFLSRLHPKKGLVNLASAWGSVAPDFPRARLVIAGPDRSNHAAQVREALQEEGVSDRTMLVGGVYGRQRLALLGHADLFVLPTFSENFGVAVAEALAAGVPVITTTGAPWRELRQRRCGWWIEPEATPLAVALREALALPDAERRQMGARGRKLVQERYSWQSVAVQMADVYRWILGLDGRPECVLTE
jgi:glycosyltransferase involved in cell wall biosynthesis